LTLQKACAAAASSVRKSSTCHPGSILIRYSEMLLLLLLLFVVAAVVAELLLLLLLLALMPLPRRLSTASATADSDGGSGAAETLRPVRRNLLCFMVSAVALWIGTSQSLHRIARSSWQKSSPLFSFKKQGGGLAPRPERTSRERQQTYLTNITKRRGLGGRGRVEEREAVVLAGEPVGAVDVTVAAAAERGFVGAAVHLCGPCRADVALYLHACCCCCCCCCLRRGRGVVGQWRRSPSIGGEVTGVGDGETTLLLPLLRREERWNKLNPRPLRLLSSRESEVRRKR
ncbi:unnamed protein product, partial [Musa textilis]